jgi:putative addiction module CopG family antidote
VPVSSGGGRIVAIRVQPGTGQCGPVGRQVVLGSVPVAIVDTFAMKKHNRGMADRQTRNVSLPPAQDAFVDAMVSAGRYRTASEVVRDGLRLLEEAEHRRLLEKWIIGDLAEGDEERVPAGLKERLEELRD